MTLLSFDAAVRIAHGFMGMTYSPTRMDLDDWTPRHFLCERRWSEQRARPSRELLATDGEMVRRVRGLPTYIAVQEFRERDPAQAVVEQLRGRVDGQHGLQGYSSVEGESVVALVRTDNGSEPAWVAFGSGDVGGEPLRMPSLPESAVEAPSLRLAAGAAVAWEHRDWVVQAALEQKGETFLSERRPLNLLDHVTDWSLRATLGTGEDHREVGIVEEGRAGTTEVRVNPHRMETVFPLDSSVYRLHAEKSDWQCWLEVEFGESLLCVPQEWRTFWIEVNGLGALTEWET